MGFKKLFKVRRPGHGEAFEKRVKSAIASARARAFPSKDSSQVSGGKEAVR